MLRVHITDAIMHPKSLTRFRNVEDIHDGCAVFGMLSIQSHMWRNLLHTKVFKLFLESSVSLRILSMHSSTGTHSVEHWPHGLNLEFSSARVTLARWLSLQDSTQLSA